MACHALRLPSHPLAATAVDSHRREPRPQKSQRLDREQGSRGWCPALWFLLCSGITYSCCSNGLLRGFARAPRTFCHDILDKKKSARCSVRSGTRIRPCPILSTRPQWTTHLCSSFHLWSSIWCGGTEKGEGRLNYHSSVERIEKSKYQTIHTGQSVTYVQNHRFYPHRHGILETSSITYRCSVQYTKYGISWSKLLHVITLFFV